MIALPTPMRRAATVELEEALLDVTQAFMLKVQGAGWAYNDAADVLMHQGLRIIALAMVGIDESLHADVQAVLADLLPRMVADYAKGPAGSETMQ